MSVVVTTVVEGREPWISEVVEMFRSLRRNGGAAAQCRCVCYSIGKPPDLAGLEVEIRPGRIVQPRDPFGNKIQCLRVGGSEETVLYLDPDVEILDDFSEITGPLSVGLAPGLLGKRLWVPLHLAVGSLPGPRFYNAGVVAVGGDLAATLADEWERILRRFWRYPVRAVASRRPLVPEPVAFAIAAQRVDVPVRLLNPLEHWHSWWGPPPAGTILHHRRRVLTRRAE